MYNGRSDYLSCKVSASVLSADMLNLKAEIDKLCSSGVDMLHFDVMDGVFVNNITFGLPVLEQVRKASDITLDVHLMITDPLKYIGGFADAGADIITFHAESESDISETIKAIKDHGVKASLSVRPSTPVEVVYPYLNELDMVLIMTVEPGFGGQSFIPETLEKIHLLKKKISEIGCCTDIEVDGGINDKTAVLVKEAGANILVSGSYLFTAEKMRDAVNKIKDETRC